MSIVRTIQRVLQRVTSTVSAPVWLYFLHPWWRRHGGKDGEWVVSGHRGRAYLDNAAALEAAAREAGQPVVWIANEPLDRELASKGVRTARRNSWAARRAISRASALVYSHGEDDLDLFLLLLRGRTAPRFYLNHCLNLLKAGGVLEPGWDRQTGLRRWFRTWLLTDCDHLLACSEVEKANFARSYPHLANKIILGGGAHLDGWERALREPPRRRIYWFPTFRDTEKGQRELRSVVAEVVNSERLRSWLVANEYELYVGTHINAGDAVEAVYKKPFVVAPRESLVTDIAQSELFVSDYSGIVFDFLLSERPQILFAFDRTEYLRERCLYVEYGELDFAIHVKTSEELVDAIVGEAWRERSFGEAATRWRRQALPSRDQDFAQDTRATIQRILQASD